jgi:hypothetical protein
MTGSQQESECWQPLNGLSPLSSSDIRSTPATPPATGAYPQRDCVEVQICQLETGKRPFRHASSSALNEPTIRDTVLADDGAFFNNGRSTP